MASLCLGRVYTCVPGERRKTIALLDRVVQSATGQPIFESGLRGRLRRMPRRPSEIAPQRATPAGLRMLSRCLVVREKSTP
jgi:hypothetical protein